MWENDDVTNCLVAYLYDETSWTHTSSVLILFDIEMTGEYKYLVNRRDIIGMLVNGNTEISKYIHKYIYFKLYKKPLYSKGTSSVFMDSKGIPEEFLKIATPISEKEFMSKWLDTKIYTKEEVDQMK